MEELKDDTLAKHLLNGSNCQNCRYSENSMCKLFLPIKVKYPEDVQVFVGGLLQYDGFSTGSNVVVMLEGKIHINQMSNSSKNNSTGFQLYGGETIQVYSRGINDEGKYECQRFSKIFQFKPFPEEGFCKYWRE